MELARPIVWQFDTTITRRFRVRVMKAGTRPVPVNAPPESVIWLARKHFFFAKKKQKTFAYWSKWLPQYSNRQKFFGSFFQIRTLP
jgi:hypothetical protein